MSMLLKLAIRSMGLLHERFHYGVVQFNSSHLYRSMCGIKPLSRISIIARCAIVTLRTKHHRKLFRYKFSGFSVSFSLIFCISSLSILCGPYPLITLDLSFLMDSLLFFFVVILFTFYKDSIDTF